MSQEVIDFKKESLETMANYFNRKLTDPVRQLYIKELSLYPNEIVRLVIKELIHECERFPRIKEVQNVLQRHVSENSTLQNYNPESDDRYPVSLMWNAFEFLQSGGKEKFREYCDGINMPIADRKRVIAKYKRAYSIRNIEIGGTVPE